MRVVGAKRYVGAVASLERKVRVSTCTISVPSIVQCGVGLQILPVLLQKLAKWGGFPLQTE